MGGCDGYFGITSSNYRDDVLNEIEFNFVILVHFYCIQASRDPKMIDNSGLITLPRSRILLLGNYIGGNTLWC